MIDSSNLPFLIGVGSPRAGTTWLYKILLHHFEICQPKNIKEINYWSNKYDKGEKWYLNHFTIKDHHKYLLDISTNYLSDKQAPKRISSYINNYYIIINLRNPYERIVSMVNYKKMIGSKKINYDNIFSNSWIRNEVQIINNINRYLKLLDKEKIIFINFDDITSNPLETINSIFEKIKIKTINDLPIKKKIHKSRNPRSAMVNKLAFKLQNLLRNKFELNFLAEKLKYSETINYLLFNNKYNDKNVFKLDDLFNKNYNKWFDMIDNETFQLEKITGNNLSHWQSSYLLNK